LGMIPDRERFRCPSVQIGGILSSPPGLELFASGRRLRV